ncbi:MAG: Bacterial alpha-L-rhamnosidase, partial [Verrucomicrobiales bacterium]|nr:Bacterial alpha-L-rhamnosidase [Verrucomicrobiales bacterium]
MKTLLGVGLLSIWILGPLTTAHADLRGEHLKCEYRTAPLGIDTDTPRLSWTLASKERGQFQTSYRIIAASAPGKLSERDADLWDSGKVDSAQSVGISYKGKQLESGQRVYWKVRVWDSKEKDSGWSEPSWFETALLRTTDWRAKWITRQSPKPLSEKEMFEDHPA